jgi:hypothetical protein
MIDGFVMVGTASSWREGQRRNNQRVTPWDGCCGGRYALQENGVVYSELGEDPTGICKILRTPHSVSDENQIFVVMSFILVGIKNAIAEPRTPFGRREAPFQSLSSRSLRNKKPVVYHTRTHENCQVVSATFPLQFWPVIFFDNYRTVAGFRNVPCPVVLVDAFTFHTERERELVETAAQPSSYRE